jgi:transketolase
MRTSFAKHLMEIFQVDNSTIMVLADIGYTVFEDLEKQFPGRIINVGIAEQNMAGISAGLALSGKNVWMYTIAPFVTLRCLEQIKLDIMFHNLAVHIVGIGSGFSYEHAGPTHHAVDDIGVMRLLPNGVVTSPGTPDEIVMCMDYVSKVRSPSYMSIEKRKAPEIKVQNREGQLNIYKRGESAVIFASGGALRHAFASTELLSKEGIEVSLYSVPIIKPIDTNTIIKIVSRYKHVFTVEEHSIIGGLGTSISEIISETGKDIILTRLGAPDEFIHEIGAKDYLLNRIGISAESIAIKVKNKINLVGNKQRSFTCRLCGSEDLIEYLSKNIPLKSPFTLLDKAQLNIDVRKIRFLKCNNCGLIQIPNKSVLQSDQYKSGNTSMSYSFIEEQREYRVHLANDFINMTNLESAETIDVGCGDGFFASQFRSLGNVYGLETQETDIIEAKGRGVTIINSLLPFSKPTQKRFDIAVCTQVLEHIEDLQAFLCAYKNLMKNGAWGLIEVPSLETLRVNNRLLDFFIDHVNYFSLDALSRLLSRYFEMVEIKNAFNGEYLVAIFRNRIDTEYLSQQIPIFNELSRLKEGGSKIALWGAGTKGVMLLTEYKEFADVICCVFDSDDKKRGKYIPGVIFPVQGPQSLNKINPDCVLVASYMYETSIKKTLANLGYKGIIISIGDKIKDH